jgi:hypothetical protein
MNSVIALNHFWNHYNKYLYLTKIKIHYETRRFKKKTDPKIEPKLEKSLDPELGPENWTH